MTKLAVPHVVAALALTAAMAAAVVTALDDAADAAPAAPEALRIATFNIEYYPQSNEQALRALEAIRALDAPLVAVQEITDPAHLQASARARLGEQWRLVTVQHRLATGLLYDSARYALVSTHTWESTVVIPGAVPVYEVRLSERARGGDEDGNEDDRTAARIVRVFVCHWKAGGDGFPVRKQQMDALAPILAASIGSGDRIVVLGDFNATGADDRVRIAQLAKEAQLQWATAGLGCTCFWQRKEDCVGSALDHVLTSQRVVDARVGGACAEGCPTTDRCPAWRDEVSDHCPVVVDLARP